MSGVHATHAEVRAPLRIVDVVAEIHAERRAELASDAHARARIDPPAVRFPFVVAVSPVEVVTGIRLPVIGLDTFPHCTPARVANRRAAPRYAVVRGLLGVVRVRADVAPEEILILKEPVAG